MSPNEKPERKATLDKRFRQKGARIAIVDVKNNNPAGIRFVKGLGFKQAESYT
jgi:ribosomal protein S18 acetylase RimI-like enzyme